MKLRVNAAELIAAQDIIDTKEKTRSIIKVECQDDGYVITATNGFALTELKSEHICEDFVRGKCFLRLSSIKKFIKAADKFIDIYLDDLDKIHLNAIDKFENIRDSIVINCTANSLFPTDDSIEKVFSSGTKAAPEAVYVNASYLCKIIKGIEKAYGKNITVSICISGEYSPIAIGTSYTESHGLDPIHKTFRSVLMPLNMKR